MALSKTQQLNRYSEHIPGGLLGWSGDPACGTV